MFLNADGRLTETGQIHIDIRYRTDGVPDAL